MGPRLRTIAVGCLVVVAALGASAVGTAAAAAIGEETDRDYGLGEDGNESRSVPGKTLDTTRSAVEGTTGRTVEAIETAVETEPEATDGAGSNRGSQDDPSVAAGVEVDTPASEETERLRGADRLSTVRLSALARPQDIGARRPAVAVGLETARPAPVEDTIPIPNPTVPVGRDAARTDGSETEASGTVAAPRQRDEPSARHDTPAVERSAAGPRAADAQVAERAGSSGSFIGSLQPFFGVPVPGGLAVPVWFVLALALAKPLLAAGSALSEHASRVAVWLRFGNDGEDPLEHDLRDDLVRWVEASPGTTLTELSDRTEASLSTVRHHLRVLEGERLLRSRKIRGNRRFFPHDAENEELIAALESEPTATIVATLRDRGAATVGELVDAVDRSYSTVSYHLGRLDDEGVIVREREGATKVTELAPATRAALGADPRATEDVEPGREVGAD